MNAPSNPLSATLNDHVQALKAHSPSADVSDAAQTHLESLLDRRARTSIRRLRYGWMGAACAGLAVLALLLVPLLGTHEGSAFAAVQKHLRDFTTLSMTITQRANGINLPTIHVLTDRKGNTRTDIGSATSVIVNVDNGTVLTLLHASHKALRFPVGSHRDSDEPKALGWLDSIRQFQGKAERLSESRVIDGRQTHGWSLRTNGMHIVLWADDDGIPHAVDIGGSMNMKQHMTLEMDMPIDTARLSTQLPPGYTLESR